MYARCERKIGRTTCGRPASVFALGQSLCAAHTPVGDPNCSHSVGIDRCALCGAPITTPV